MATVRKSTLSDVARRAGVSATTASYILNGRSAQMRISSATQDRVLKAAADLHYRPNPSARSLRTSTTRTVGVISDLVAGGSFASQMLTGASAAARMLAHLIVIGESQGDPQLEALLVEAGSSLVYFTGIQWWRSERLTAALIPAEGTPVIVTPEFEEPSVRETLKIAADVRVWNEHQSPTALLADWLKARGTGAGPVY